MDQHCDDSKSKIIRTIPGTSAKLTWRICGKVCFELRKERPGCKFWSYHAGLKKEGQDGSYCTLYESCIKKPKAYSFYGEYNCPKGDSLKFINGCHCTI